MVSDCHRRDLRRGRAQCEVRGVRIANDWVKYSNPNTRCHHDPHVLFATRDNAAAGVVSSHTPRTEQVAVFSGGCFWGVQAVFQHVVGVTNAVSGYAGGDAANAHYDRVSEGNTGHAESVRVTFDPSQVSYEQLLQVFFTVAHDPTQLNFQGPDHGPQYRSAIWFTNEQQQMAAKSYIAQLMKAKTLPRPIVTEVAQRWARSTQPSRTIRTTRRFTRTNPTSCINDAPKVAQLKKQFPALYRDEAGARER